MKNILILIGIAILATSAGCGGSSSSSDDGGGGDDQFANVGAAVSGDGTSALMADTSGNFITLSNTGVGTWQDASGNSITVHFGSDGWPQKIVADGNIVLLDGWDTDNNTVNIGLIQADGTVQTEHNVAVDATTMSRLAGIIADLAAANQSQSAAQIASKIFEEGNIGPEKLFGIDFEISSDDIATGLGLVGTGVSAFACGFVTGSAIVSQVTWVAVPLACTSTVITVSNLMGYTDEDNTALGLTEDALTVVGAVQCGTGDAGACLETGITLAQTVAANADEILNAFSSEVESTLTSLEYGGGAIQVTLSWETAADIDLYVTDPNSEMIFYSHTTSASGGYLDHDDTDGGTASNPAIENVFWESDPLDGSYQVGVEYWSGDSTVVSTQYTVTIFVDGSPVGDPYTGTLANPGDGASVTAFAYPQ